MRGGLATLAAEPDQKVQATLWRGMTADKASGAELEILCRRAARCGDDAVRAMRRRVAGSSRRRLRRASTG